MNSENTPKTASPYMTIEAMENYVPYEVFRLALSKLTMLEQAVNALPDFDSLPSISRVTTVSENMSGEYFIRWSAADPLSRDMKFFLKVGVEDFKRIYPISSGEFYTYLGSGAPTGGNPCFIKLDNGKDEIISDLFTIAIPEDPSITPPIIEPIENIKGLIGETIKIIYHAYDEKTEIVKHEFSDDGNTYDITSKVLKAGEKFIYTITYNTPVTIKNAYITVYNRNGLRKKSNDFTIVVEPPVSPPSLLSFEIVPLEYKTESEEITIKYKTEKPLENVKISLNGGDYISASKFNNEEATFSVKGVSNGTYTAKLRGYYKEDARSVKNN